MQGTICKGIAGFYYVWSEGRMYECKARGKFRNKGIVPLVGDDVILSEDKSSKASDPSMLAGCIDEILQRKNEFDRPPVANVDLVVIVTAVKEPNPLTYIIDRMAVAAELSNTKIAICINKDDLGDAKILKATYSGIYPVFAVSAKNGDGVAELKDFLKNKKTALCGPSGVGKSSLTNILLNKNVQTGEISAKTLRGKNTTRHSELFAGDGFFLFDTPGFTSFETPQLEESELQSYFPEFLQYVGKCRFADCTHQNEPDCAIKNALSNGQIANSRYDSYLQMYKELKERKKF